MRSTSSRIQKAGASDGQKLLVCVAGLVFAGGFAACGTGGRAPSTATAPPTAAFTVSAGPTSAQTKSPLKPNAPEVTQVMALSGFPEFARQFAAAVDANDTQFFIDRAYFQTFHCVVPGETPSTESACQGMGAPPTEPAIPVGLWNSEGEVFTIAAYGELIQDRLSEEHAPAAYTFGLGHQIRGADEQSSGVDLIVADVAQPDVPSGQTPLRPPALVFRADVINGQWRLVSADRASTPDIPYFFNWYAQWGDVFPPA